MGGATGDIEGLPFLEAIREFALEVGYNNALFLHVTYVPFIKAAGELKTKPTQQSVAKLREIGITPHILVCRCEQPLDKELRQKISMFCNVPYEAVIEEKDVDHSIYEVPLMLQRERRADLVGGILVPGGFGERGIEGKIMAAKYARENKVPYLGLCLGMQIATIEFARNVLKLDKAHSTEFDPGTPHPVIALLDDQKKVIKKGGTMRLGAQPCQMVVCTRAAQLYGAFVIHERHRHRYEFNNAYRRRFASAHFVFSGKSPDGKLVEIIELAN